MQLYKGWPGIPHPTKQKDDIRGEIPARALKFCEPFLSANRVGWLVYPPVDFTVVWTGAEVLLNFADMEETVLLDRVFIPDFHEYWCSHAPEAAVEVMPPFLEAFPERGVLQVWSGLFVVTEPGISTWVRAPINRGRSSAYSILEGIVETDWWVGPLFFVMQIDKTDFPIKFSTTEPFLQIFPFDRSAAVRMNTCETLGLSEFSEEKWTALRENALRRNTEPPGSYRRESRRRLHRGAG